MAVHTGFFHSNTEDNPWLRIQLNRKEKITSVTIRNRLDEGGERLENLEVRAGTKNDNTNEIVGTFAGPGFTGGRHVVQFTKPVVADFLTFQLKKKNAILQINGIFLNERPVLGKNIVFVQWIIFCHLISDVKKQSKVTYFYRQLGCLASSHQNLNKN